MRAFTWLLVLILSLLVGLMLLGCLAFSAPPYVGAPSDHFNGEQFFNPGDGNDRSFGRFLHWMWTREPGAWLDWVDVPQGEKPPSHVGEGNLRATFVNHSTVLIQMDGLNILTDPVWAERIGPLPWLAGPKRHRPPGIAFDDLPHIDVVLISHNHYDHLNLPTLKRLALAHRPVFIVPLGNKALLEAGGIAPAFDLDWWDERALSSEVTVTAVPARHFSSRGLCDRNRTLWAGFVIQGPSGVVYFAGDTAWGEHIPEIRERFGPPRLALLPIGAFMPKWFMSRAHLSPAQTMRAHRELEAGTSIATHFGTFRLGDDGMFTPVEESFRAMDKQGISPVHFWVMENGQGREIPPLAKDDPASETAGDEPPEDGAVKTGDIGVARDRTRP